MSEARWAIEWRKNEKQNSSIGKKKWKSKNRPGSKTESLYVKGHVIGRSQVTVQARSPWMYDGQSKRHTFIPQRKLWRVFLSGTQCNFRHRGDKATYYIRNDSNSHMYLHVDRRGPESPELKMSYCRCNAEEAACEFFIEYAPESRSSSTPRAPRVEDSVKRLLSVDFLAGGMDDDRDSISIPVYISCALKNGDSYKYLGCDDLDNIVLTDIPHNWFLRRGRNAIGKNDVKKVAKELFTQGINIASNVPLG